MIRVAILTISDKGVSGRREDKSGRVIADKIKEIDGQEVYYEVIPDEFKVIREKLFGLSENWDIDLVLTTGGTGFAKRDITPEATGSIIEKEVPGIPEKMRSETSQKTPLAYLSRARAGIRKRTLIINLPGSPVAVEECLDAVMDIIPHGIDILQGNITEHKVEHLQEGG